MLLKHSDLIKTRLLANPIKLEHFAEPHFVVSWIYSRVADIDRGDPEVMAGRRAAAQGEKGLRSQEYWNVTIKF